MRTDSLLVYATSFSLGHENDEDRRPFVLVARIYNCQQKWMVATVTEERGVHSEEERRFSSQTDALQYGWALLGDLRPEAG